MTTPSLAPQKPDIFCFVGPSGAGKGSIIGRLSGDFQHPVSWTSRPPREGEQDEVDYHFTTREAVTDAYKGGSLFEINEFGGNLYGAPLPSASDPRHAIYDIDINGAMRLARAVGKRLQVLAILPPSDEALEYRLRQRGTETDEKIAERLVTWWNKEKPRLTNSGSDFYFHLGFFGAAAAILVNSGLDRAVQAAQSIIDSGDFPALYRQPDNDYGLGLAAA